MILTQESQLCVGPHGSFRLAYTCLRPIEASKPPVVCIHGLTRNGRDFDILGEHLADRRLVVSPDMPGRGKSDWLSDKTDYSYPLYINAITTLIDHLGCGTIDYVGTSMGGIIGMILASQPNTPIRRLVLNDVGPLIPKAALHRMSKYVGKNEKFADLAAVETYFRSVAASFGRLTDAQWRAMAEHGHRRLENGALGLAYDPDIGLPLRGEQEDVDLWMVYDQIRCPTLVVRGAKSDLLLRETAHEMAQRGPKAELYEVAEAGHAPALMALEQIETIERFLDR